MLTGRQGGRDFRGRLGGKGQVELGEQEGRVFARLDVAREGDGASVGGRQDDVHHLEGLELVDDLARGQARGARASPSP